MTLSKTSIRVASISNRVVLARVGKDPNVALETKDATSDFMKALVQYVFDGKMPPKGDAAEVSFGGGDEHFVCTVRRLPTS